MRMTIGDPRRNTRCRGRLVSTLLLALSLVAAAQVHVERSRDGKILIKNIRTGEELIYPPPVKKQGR